MSLSFKFPCDSSAPSCGRTVRMLRPGCMAPRSNEPWQYQCPLSNAHYISLSESFYVYSWLIASICFGQLGAAVENMPSDWLTTVASCVWQALPHRDNSQETQPTCWCNRESVPCKQTHHSELFPISRCDWTVLISYTGGLSFAEVYKTCFAWNLVH